jgi:CBS domain-containing protein
MVHLMQNGVHVADRSVVAISQPAPTVAAEATLDEALRALLNASSRYLVVVAHDGRFVGVLGGRELVAEWANSAEAFVATPVTGVLASVSATVSPTATVRTVARVMRDFRSDVVVVIGPGRVPVGVVTADDLAAHIAGPGS